YKATGNNQFQRAWEWQDDHASDIDVAYVNIFDMNNNGYNEIVFSGNGKISIFEIEAVRVLTPNGGQSYLPGDSVLIQWQKFYPPRCDSFSLSYTTDNGRTYQPVLNSIPSTESTYNWIVPNTPSESCRVKVTAYGPGTQFDESDALFTIQPSGISETELNINQPLRLEINPNPFKTKTIIRLNKPIEKPITFKIYNASGGLVKTLTLNPKQSTIIWNGKDKNDKSLPSGVYILQCDSKELTMTQKLVIEK
ncbi:MAG: T9SS type A sorting domain-containing protein, partial [candidate division WOR-3 bacterium]|nr:T9SS type A sorting domain-containing protein [candidate division WOR-3 bacterium]